jgi:hypothetical protein
MKPDHEPIGRYIREAQRMSGDNDFGKRSDDNGTIEIKLPFVTVRAKGRTVAMVVTILFAGSALAWWAVRHDDRSAEQNAATVEALREMAYVMTLTEAERKALQLLMPTSMRDRLLRQRDQRASEYRRNDQ